MKMLNSTTQRAAAVASVAVPVLATSKLTAALVSQLGVTYQVAATLAFALVNGGAAAAIALWPLIAPIVATAEAMAWIFGTATVISF